MPTANEKFRLENDTSKTTAEGPLFHFKEGQRVLSGYHSKELPQAVENYGTYRTRVNRYGLEHTCLSQFIKHI